MEPVDPGKMEITDVGDIKKTRIRRFIIRYDGKGCPNMCGTKYERWSLKKLNEKITDEQKENNDYSLVTKNSFDKGVHSILKIICRKCDEIYEQSPNNHINLRHGCPNLCGTTREKWSLRKFNRRITDKQREKNDYSFVNGDSFKEGGKSILKIICRRCDKIYEKSVEAHLNGKNGCPNKCDTSQERWSLKKFNDKITGEQRSENDYSLIKEDSFNEGQESLLEIICRTCKKTYKQTVKHHMINKCKCTNCTIFKGEEASSLVFDLSNIPYEAQWCHKGYRYDFVLFGRDCYEYDGSPHFSFVEWYHKTEQRFRKRQNDDVIKTKMALEMGWRIIRIDYTQINNIKFHIEEAYKTDRLLYLSTPEMYKYITDNLPSDFLNKRKEKDQSQTKCERSHEIEE